MIRTKTLFKKLVEAMTRSLLQNTPLELPFIWYLNIKK